MLKSISQFSPSPAQQRYLTIRTLTLTLGAGVLSLVGLHVATEIFVRARALFFENKLIPLCLPLNCLEGKQRRVPKGIVTGGLQGIGLELVVNFVRLGYDVEVWDNEYGKLEVMTTFNNRIQEAIKNISSGHVLPRSSSSLPVVGAKRVDIGNLQQVTKACEEFLAANGNNGPDFLVLNAGMIAKRGIGSFPTTTTTHNSSDQNDNESANDEKQPTISRCFNVNVTVHILELLNILLPSMKRQHSDFDDNDYCWRKSIVLISSVTAFSGFAGASEYCATKAAVVSVGDSLRAELRVAKEDAVAVASRSSTTTSQSGKISSSSDIDVVTVCPYLVQTKMFDDCLDKPPFWFYGAMDPKWVADKILNDGIRYRRECLVLPRFFYLMPIVKAAVPSWVWLIADNLMNASRWFSG